MQGAFASAAAKAGRADPGLVDRSLTRWAGDTVRKQQAREDVAVRTVNLLSDDPPSDDVAGGPSDDFMNYVEDVAEKASSEALRDLMVRIRAGEIRSSGIVSRRALQAAGLMDQRAAQALWKIRPWIAIKPSRIWQIGEVASAERASRFGLPDSLSIVRIGELGSIDHIGPEIFIVHQQGGVILHLNVEFGAVRFFDQVARMSDTGREFCRSCPSLARTRSMRLRTLSPWARVP